MGLIQAILEVLQIMAIFGAITTMFIFAMTGELKYGIWTAIFCLIAML